MKENVGTVDRMLRTVVGSGLVAVGYTRWGGNRGRGPGLVAMIGGALLLESAVTRVCPINALLGIDTRDERLVERDRNDFQLQEIGRLIEARLPLS